MLYNSTREELLQAGKGYTAMIADALYSAGFPAGASFSAADAITALKPLGTPLKAIRAGLYHRIFKPRGRRHIAFTMPEPNEARIAVGASVLRIRDNLPTSAFKSLKAYRQALHHALIKRRPGKYTRGLLAKRLGVSKQTTRNYDRASGHKVEPQLTRTPLLAYDIENLPAQKVKLKKRRSWLGKIDSEGFIVAYAPSVKAIALKWIKEGFKVEILEQTANHYSLNSALDYSTGELSEFIHS